MAAAAMALLVSAPLRAAGQPPRAAAPEMTEAVKQAAEHFARGVRLYQEDDFRAALIEFRRAYDLAPNWAVLYNVGQAEYQLRDYAGALGTLQKYVQLGGDTIPAERRSQVEHEVDELHGRVAHVTVSSNVDADVSLDDAPLGRASAADPRLVSAGRHKFTASLRGFVAASKVVDIAGGDDLSIRLDLVPEPKPEPIVAVRRPAPQPPNFAWATVSGVVGAAGIAVGSVYGVLTLQTKRSLDAACSPGKVCPPSSQGDIDAYARNGTISGVGFGVGAAGLLLGTILFLNEQSREQPRTGRLVPWIGPGAGGFAFTF